MNLEENDLCPCGSLKRYAHCCGQHPPVERMRTLLAAMNSARFAEAAVIAGELIERQPQLGVLWKIYGVALLRQGSDASLILRRAVELLPRDPEAHYYLGSLLQGRGEMEEAIVRFRRALELQPDYTRALVDLADALQQRRQYAEAAAGYRRALSLEPALAEVHNNLGNALRDDGKLPEAVASYHRALEIKPHFAEALCNLGRALRLQGNTRDAIDCYRHALQLKPEFAEAHNNLGNALRDLGQLTEAEASYRRAIALHPRFADAHNNLGNLQRDVGRLHEALRCYGRALDINPRLAEAHNNRGNVLLDLMQLDEAGACYERALQLKPDYVHAHTALAMVLRQQGHAQAAEASCRKALAITPGCAESIAFLAELQADKGRFEEAAALFRRALEIDPNLPAALAGLARYRRMNEGDVSWLAAAQRLAQQTQPVRHEIYLRYAIGKYFDDFQDYEQAFQNYQRANELTKRYGATFDRAQLTRQIDAMINKYDRQWLRQSRMDCDESQRAIFVIGMPRSGTTLAEQILASHPEVFGAGELPFWSDAATDYHASPSPETLARLGSEYLQRLGKLSAESSRLVDKMPNNFLNLGLIHAALPMARVVHMRRNPIDTCLSIYFQNFSIAHAYANDLEDLAYYYAEYSRLMAHWHATLPEGTILDVSYDGLVSHPETWSRKMLNFLELPWDERCLDFHKTERTVITPSKWQVRQKISSHSSGRWRNYERFVGPLLHLLPSSPP